MQRFYFPDITLTPSLTIREEGFIHQISRVLRSAPGDTIVLFCGDGNDYIYSITSITRKDVSLTLTDIVANTTDPHRIIRLYQALPNKYEKIEWIIQKWVEIGISTFVFFLSERSQRLAMNEKKIARFHEIAREALEQSGGNTFPEIVFLDMKRSPTPPSGTNLVLHTNSEDSEELRTRSASAGGDEVNLFIGPEGGWSESEIDDWGSKGAKIVHIRGRIMRTETAGIVVAFHLLHV